MRRAAMLSLAVLLAGLTACSPFTFAVHSRHDPGVRFAALRTFGWLPASEAAPADQQTQDPTFDRRIRDDVERGLREMGYEPAGGARPDFLLNYRLATLPVSRVLDDPFGDWGGSWARWPAHGSARLDASEQGALFLGTIDPATRHMTWVGFAEARLLPDLSYEKTLVRIDDAVAAILKDFPAPAR